MTAEERAKLERIARQAMNIQVMEVTWKTADSDGEPIGGTDHTMAVIYNKENILAEEVEELLHSGKYRSDSRILLAEMDQLASIFPHRGESKKALPVSYWKPMSDKNDYSHCQCSSCGAVVPAVDAVKIGCRSDDYIDVIYRFCPKCGSVMYHKADV